MPTLNVSIKHAGKTHPVTLVTEQPARQFKEDVYQLTGVPVERMKVMVKGGILKDDADWARIGPKEGQTFMVIGAAGELPKPPEKKTLFVEDMDEEDLAQALTLPIGLKNLGNTCYMNATIQALRAVPELQLALDAGTGTSQLPRSLRDLYKSMGRTSDSFIPATFLTNLRQVYPQFAEMSRGGSKGMMGGYAQQDAEECYSQILTSLRDVPVPEGVAESSEAASGKKFIEQYMMAEVRRELKSDEAPEEPPTIQFEKTMKIECNINSSTNYMAQGIDNALKTTLSKQSPTLGRTAEYTQTSRLSRLPAYLTVHMVRFAWRSDVGPSGGKAKIMRKVKFPTTYDALDIATPELKEKLLPASRKLLEFEKEREERKKVRRRTRKAAESSSSAPRDEPAPGSTDTPAAENASENVVQVELEPEETYRKKEVEELISLVSPEVKNDLGSSWTGVYELIAIITHKGAAADAGHYIGFAKKSAFARPSPSQSKPSGDGDVTMGDATSSSPSSHNLANPNLTPLPGAEDEDGEEWIKFDDEKVSLFPKEKLATLDGGGEDSSAYVLLYRTKSF